MMQRISSARKKIAALVLIASASFFIFAAGWPVREGTLTANFGLNDGSVPLLGNDIAASGSVFPSGVGELIFAHDPENPASRFPSPLGSWMALDHGDNMVGIYSRYEDRRDAPVPSILEPGTVLASAGSTGWAREDGLHFGFFDRSERRWVNPAIIISGSVSGDGDTVPPVIRQVELRNVAGTSINPALVQRLPQGLYTIYVDAFDTLLQGGAELAPNRITCSVNGEETGVLSFETLVSREGERMAYRNGLVSTSRVYDDNGFGLGEIHLTRGQATVVVEVRDIADNARTLSFRLTVD
jgi:hypothetical protein